MKSTFWMTAAETEQELKRRMIPRACPICHQPMRDGDVVVMDWAGEAVNHVNCERQEN